MRLNINKNYGEMDDYILAKNYKILQKIKK